MVNAVVTREVQQLRVEMHQEFQRSRCAMIDQIAAARQLSEPDHAAARRLSESDDAAARQPVRWLMTSMIVLFLAMLGNILKDFLR